MKTKIFEYKGFVGIEAGDQFVNDPTQKGQLGCIVKIENVEISKGAFDFLFSLRKSHDAIGDVMCWGEYFAWMGGYKMIINKNCEGDRDYNPELLKSQICEVEPTEDFKNFIDRKE